MTDEAKEARRAYHREYKRKWRQKNPGKDKEYEERHWERVAAEQKEKSEHEEKTKQAT